MCWLHITTELLDDLKAKLNSLIFQKMPSKFFSLGLWFFKNYLNQFVYKPLKNFSFSIKQVYSQIHLKKTFLPVSQKLVLHKITSSKGILIALSENVARFYTGFSLQCLQLSGLHCTEMHDFLCSSNKFLKPGTKYFLLN